MSDATKPKKIKVEVEVDDREVELHIDPETGHITLEDDLGSLGALQNEDGRDDREAEQEHGSGGIGLVLGVLLGLAAGAVGGIALVRQLARPAPGASQDAQDAQEGPSDDPLAFLRARWREATHQGRAAAEQEAQRKLARYRELTEIEPNPPGGG